MARRNSRQLIIRPGAIGDCLLWLPALCHVAGDNTELWITSSVVPLIPASGCNVRAVYSIASTGLDLLGIPERQPPDSLVDRVRSFDSILSWYGANRPEFRSAITALGVPCDFFTALPPVGYAGHATDFFTEQVGAPHGQQSRINVNPVPARGTVVIQPFSGSARKNWPLENYRALARQIPAAVEWTAGPEESLPEAVRFESLADLASWLTGARLYIGNDSGITHLAAAVETPTLAVFGPTSPATWAPRGDNVTVLHHDSIAGLEVSAVLQVASRLLGSP